MNDLISLSEKLSRRLAQPLLGSAAHEPMRANPVGAVRPNFEHQLPPKPGSVLILLYEYEGKIKFPLIKRPEYSGAHSGQISLPGGKAEPGEDYLQTALREGEEEIGVRAADLNIIGRLSEFFVMPSNYLIIPVVAYSLTKPTFIPQETEVVRILEGSLNDIIRDDAIKVKEILAAKKYPMLAPHFLIEDEIVWGATAMMLNEFRMIVREILSL
jgi:8-oxo-dGTP pyrophosphatase MutT (NUDIX family)